MQDQTISSMQRSLRKKLERHEPALRRGLRMAHGREMGIEFARGILQELGGNSLAADVPGTYGQTPASPAAVAPRGRGRPSKTHQAAAGRRLSEPTPPTAKRARRGRGAPIGGHVTQQSAG